jgi:U32 family peptidase
MIPKSVLNDLRRQAITELLSVQESKRIRTIHANALAELRQECNEPGASAPGCRRAEIQAELHVLIRTMEQLEAVVEWRQSVGQPLTPSPSPAKGRGEQNGPLRGLVYCDFEDVRRYREAVTFARSHGHPIGLATLRILKPGEEGFLAQIAHAGADAVLVRNLAALAYFRDRAPHTAMVGDFSLNVANELTADLFFREGMSRLVPSYDLNWEQLAALLKRTDPARFEVVVHQHMPMFHMEHCVFAALLSKGKDWRDCGRPCDRHEVSLRDRVGASFPLAADTGCRNTVFNSIAQSAAEFIPRMLAQGVRHFRVELLRETAAETNAILDRYNRVIAGLDSGRGAWRQLQVLNQLGVTRGTLAAR